MRATLRSLSLAVLVLVLAGCDGEADPAQDPVGEEAPTPARFVAVDIDYAEVPAPVPSGDVAVELVNDGDLTHNVTIEGVADGLVTSAQGGETSSGTVALEPGEYVAYCSVEGHREAGMETTLVVED